MTSESVPAWKPWIAFFSCVVIWGSTFLVIRIGNESVPPLWAATVRLILAGAFLFALTAILRQPLPRGDALRAAMIYGLFQFGGNFSLLYWGETVVPSGLAAVIFATIPLSTTLLTRVFGLERLTGRKILGALIALAGVALIMSGRLERGELIPTLAILVATWLACIGTIALKKGPKQPVIPLNAVACAVGAPVCFALSVLAGEPHALPVTREALIPILYLTIAGSVGAFVVFTWLVSRWPITRTSYIAVVLPIVALLLGAAVRGERFSPAAIAGSAVVLVGVTIGLGLIGLPGPARAAQEAGR